MNIIIGVGEEESQRLFAVDRDAMSDAERLVHNLEERRMENFNNLTEEDKRRLEAKEEKAEKKKVRVSNQAHT